MLHLVRVPRFPPKTSSELLFEILNGSSVPIFFCPELSNPEREERSVARSDTAGAANIK